MINQITALILPGAMFIVLFAIAEVLYHKAKVKAGHTRKLVHAGTGMLTLLFPAMLDHAWQVAVLCGTFLLLLLATLQFGWLPSIHRVNRKTNGSLLFPIIVFLVFLFYLHSGNGAVSLYQKGFYYYLPILTLAFCDPVAALIGGWYKQKKGIHEHHKTGAGTLAFFLSGLLLMLLLLIVFGKPEVTFYAAFIGGVSAVSMAAFAERISKNGWDNFTIPASVAGVIWMFEYAWSH